jgi:hypothetical protein
MISNEELFRIHASEHELDALREQTPRTIRRQNRVLARFRDELARKYTEEARVGLKIYLLDYIFYNKDLVARCTWADVSFKQKVLGALGTMADYLANAIQTQVDQSVYYN